MTGHSYKKPNKVALSVCIDLVQVTVHIQSKVSIVDAMIQDVSFKI